MTSTTLELRHQNVNRYILPLREGGSLPALVEADDGFRYALKFKGGGHGSKALISELVGGEIARAANFNVPELVFLNVDERFGITESDEEIRELLEASRGLNLGLHYLSGAMNLDPYVNPIDELTASKIVWLDAFLLNVDRTVRNTNMLLWHGEPWLIDHGASLYFHHNWDDRDKAISHPFPYIKDHAFIHKATELPKAGAQLQKIITPSIIANITALIPDEWLQWDGVEQSPDELRNEYRRILTSRLASSEIFLNQAIAAHESHL